jgi:hypothetical protein
MSDLSRVVAQNQGPLASDLGTPVSTKPAPGTGIFNNTVGTAAEKVLSKSTSPRGCVRRVKLYNPTTGVTLGYTTTTGVAPTLTSTVVGGGATDGSCVAPQSSEYFNVADNCDVYLSASAAASPYQLTVVEV